LGQVYVVGLSVDHSFDSKEAYSSAGR